MTTFMDVISPEPCPKPFGDILSETGALVEPLSLATGTSDWTKWMN